MRKLKLTIQYEGTQYSGWQRQKEQPTIQQCIEEAISKVVQEDVTILGAGRTDAGVHARGQAAHLKTESSLPVQNIKNGTNANLPADIRICDITEVNESFHAIRDAVKREYRYFIYNNKDVSVLWRRFALYYRQPLNIGKLKQYCRVLKGTHDFSSFASSDDANESKVRKISKFTVHKKDSLITFIIQGNAFLQHQVRTMIGTMLDFERNNKSVHDLREVLEKRNREYAGQTGKAHGLWLWKVWYPKELDNG